MADILIKNGFLITMDEKRRTIVNGGVVVENNKIIDVGDTARLTERYRAETVIDAKNKVILPGLVNTHTHLFQMLMKSLADDMTLFDWWPKVVAPLSIHLQKDHCYFAALSGCLELIRSGCTCTMDNHYPLPIPGLADECVKAFVDVGIRAIEALGTTDTEKPYFPMPKELLMETDRAIKENVELIRRWNGAADDTIHVWFGTDSPFDCTDELLEAAHDLSKTYGVGVCCHLHECEDEIVQWKKETGLTPIQYYHKRIRFIDSNLVALHCVKLDNEDMRILAEKDVKVSHNPLSNMYMAHGIAPIPKLLKLGLTVGLGVDGPASNNNQDMFELMKTTALLHKAALGDPLAITAEKVLEMATIDGAKTLGLEGEIGSIKSGKKADIILVNLAETNMIPLNNIVSQLVYCGKASNVDSVIIDGRIVMKNKVVQTVQEGEVTRKTQEMADDLIRRGNMNELRTREWTSRPTKEGEPSFS